MANPQPDEYTRISNELYTAIMQTDFSKRQRNIIDLVIRMSYGCGKKTAILRPVDFQLVGVYKTHVSQELEYLSKARVISIDGSRAALNKNYDEWRISLDRSADPEHLHKVLRINLEDLKSYQNGNQKVTETVTHEGTEVTNTVTRRLPKQ